MPARPIMTNLKALVLISANSGALLGVGSHRVKIVEISPSTPKGTAFKDPTPQLKIVFKDLVTGKQFTEWYNIVGYRRFNELDKKDQQSGLFTSNQGYAVHMETGMRVEDLARTESAQSILNKVGHDAGIAAGVSFEPKDLMDRELIITVGESNDAAYNNLRIKGTRPVSAVVTAEEV